MSLRRIPGTRNCLNMAIDVDRFWSHVRKTDKCWVWTGVPANHGYGQFRVGDKKKLVHRLSWEMANGPIPDGLCVCHHCDNPICVRPEHLFLGTKQQNHDDMLAKGRRNVAKGQCHGNAVLSDVDVITIRALYHWSSFNIRDISNEYGVSFNQVWLIVNNKSRLSVRTQF